MKCDNCLHSKHHPAGSWDAVAEGYDDPYNYDYCQKGHWCGGMNEPQDELQVEMDDPWANCNDYIKAD